MPCISSAPTGRLHAAKWGKCLLDHKTNSCCSLGWYEQKSEVVWYTSSARACAALSFPSYVLRWEQEWDLSTVSPDAITQLQGQCCSFLNKNVCHQQWACLVEYQSIILRCTHTDTIIIIMGNDCGSRSTFSSQNWGINALKIGSDFSSHSGFSFLSTKQLPHPYSYTIFYSKTLPLVLVVSM